MDLARHVYAAAPLLGRFGGSLYFLHLVRVRTCAAIFPCFSTDAAGILSEASVRIYLPVWASLAVALLLTRAVPRVSSPELSSWVNKHDETPNVVFDAVLLGGASMLNGPLWSLRYEMLFSLLLPLYVILVPPIRRLWFPALAGLLLLIAVGNIIYSPLPVYMPMFGIGVLMASRREDLEKWGGKLRTSGWIAVVTASLFLLCSRWLLPQLPLEIFLASLGGALLIFAFVAWQPASTLGTRPLTRWLGLRSFSLYLVHEPILIALTFAMRSTDVLQMTLLTLPLSLLAAELFFRLVEQPSQRLAAAAGRIMDYRSHRKAKVG